MSTIHLSRRRATARAGLVSLAAVAASSLGLSAASAAPDLAIPLDPQELLAIPVPVENLGTADLLTDPGTGEFQVVPAQQAGTVELDLPAGLDGTDGVVTLDLAPDLESDPTASYSSDAATSPLVVVPDADGDLTVTLPADPANGPIGLLTVDGITSGVDGVQVAPLDYVLELFAAGDPKADPAAQLAPQLVAVSTVPCPLSSVDPCPTYTAQAGSSITVSVPADSLLPQLGLGTLENLHVTVTPDMSTAPEPIELTGGQQAAAAAAADAPADQPAAAELAQVQELATGVSGTPDAGTELTVAAAASGAEPTATVALPADLPAGDYVLTVVEGTTAVGLSTTSAPLTVEAPPAAPAAVAVTPPPVQQNAGLVSDTGWIEPTPAEDGGSSVLVLVGGGTLLTATVGAIAVLRPRRRSARS